MRILALDISKNAPGFAVFEDNKILDSGTLNTSLANYGHIYPFNILETAKTVAAICFSKVIETRPQLVVVEQINLGRNRNTQRILEWIHMGFAIKICDYGGCDLKYISTSTWRKLAGVSLTKDDKRLNSKLSSAKSKAKKEGLVLNKKSLGIRGRFTKKHAAVRWANEQFGLNLKVCNNDQAEALAIGKATYIALRDNLNVFCDGKGI